MIYLLLIKHWLPLREACAPLGVPLHIPSPPVLVVVHHSFPAQELHLTSNKQ